MGLQFYNIKREVFEKPLSNGINIDRRTSVKKKVKYTDSVEKLTKNNLNFLRSLKAL